MDRPHKKIKGPKPDFESYTCAFPSVVFELVFPFLFPGYYGKDRILAFRTYLALAGTCQALRYFQVLRRWVGYLAPSYALLSLEQHGFPVGISTDKRQVIIRSRRVHQMIVKNGIVSASEDLSVMSMGIVKGFFHLRLFQESSMDMQINGSAVFGVMRCEATRRNNVSRVIYAVTCTEFSEMVLVAHQICADTADWEDVSWLLIAGWKTTQKDHIYFTNADKTRFMNKFLLGRLKKIGLTAPRDEGFALGDMNHTSFSWFHQLCDTSGQRGGSMSPFERLDKYVRTWFPLNLRLTESEEKSAPHYKRVQFI